MNTYTEKQVQEFLSAILTGCLLTSQDEKSIAVHDVSIELVGDSFVQVFVHTNGEKHPYCAVPLHGPTIRKQSYTQEVLRTYAGSGTQMDKFTLGALGLAGESGEVVDMIKKILYQGHRLDFMKLLEELGDVLWYIALMCDALEVTLDDALDLNVQKLHKRYPNGFEVERSINR